jgi:hypothetical protein
MFEAVEATHEEPAPIVVHSLVTPGSQRMMRCEGHEASAVQVALMAVPPLDRGAQHTVPGMPLLAQSAVSSHWSVCVGHALAVDEHVSGLPPPRQQFWVAALHALVPHVIVLPLVPLQLTETFVMFAVPIVPLPLATLHVWPLGCVLTETAYALPPASAVPNVNPPLDMRVRSSPPLFWRTTDPDRPVTVPPTV